MADKKISELPILGYSPTNTTGDITSSGVGLYPQNIVPVVVGGTTYQISLQNFSRYVTQYNATTGSNTFIGNQTVQGNVTTTGNLIVQGKLTAQEVHTEITSASIIFESGSTIFGNSGDDTHQFTGVVSINGITIGAQAVNDFTASTDRQLQRVYQTTSSLNIFTGSQDSRNYVISEFTSSTDAHIVGISTYTSSLEAQLRRVYQTTASLNIFTGSQDSRNFIISQFTSSTDAHIVGVSTYTSSLEAQLRRVYQTTSSLNIFTGSQDSRNFVISQFTSSTDEHIVGVSTYTSSLEAQLRRVYQTTSSLNIFTGSQDSRNYVISQFTASTDNHILGISIYTASIDASIVNASAVTASIFAQLQRVYQTTSSLNIFTGSQDSRNFVISQFTSSTDAHIVGISTYTSSLEAQLSRVYQTTSSLNIFTGSQDSRNYVISQFTSSTDAHIVGISAFTSSQLAVNLGNSIFTSSARIELNSIEAYTASLKNAISVSGNNVQIVGDLNVNKLNVQYISSSVLITSGSNVFGDQSTDKHEFTGSVYLQNSLLLGTEVLGNAGLNSFTASTNNSIVGVSAFTSSQLAVNLGNSIYTASVNNHILDVSIYTSSVNNSIVGVSAFTSSQLTVNLNNSIFTSSARIELNSIEAYTSSLKAAAIVSSSAQVQNYDVFALNSNLYNSTGSIQSEINGLMALTASLKAAAIVSSSQQIKDYFTFAQTSSANTTFYGNVTASGNLQANQLYIGGATTSTGLIGASEAVVQNELGIQFGDATGTYMRMIANTANSNTAIVAGAFSGAEPPLDLIVGGNTQMRLRADGNNGINTTTPVFTGLTGSLTIRKSYNNDIASVPTTTGQNYYSNQSGLYLFGRNSGITIVGGNSEEATICYGNQSTHRFASISAGTGTDAVGGDLYIKVGSDTERLRIGSTGDGNVTVSTGNLIMGTSGKGIDFSATSNSSGTTSSEILSDYEEGTWTPTVFGSSTAGTYTLSGTTAYYTKIGNQVTVFANFGFSAASGGSGYVTIGGLPFNYRANNSSVGTIVGINFDFSAGVLYAVIAATSSSSTNQIFIQEIQDNTTSTEGQIAGVSTSTTFRFTYTYTVS